MIQKSNKMIMFAVIAAIIVIIPVSFYEFSVPPGAIIVSVRNGASNDVWDIYRDNNTSTPIIFQNITSNSTFTSSNSLNSSLNLSFNCIWGYCNAVDGFFSLHINYFNISGILRGNLKPTGITVTQVDAAQIPDVIKFALVPLEEKVINTSLINGWNFYSWNTQTYNKTNTYIGASLCNVSLRNDSVTQHTLFPSLGSQKNLTYRFEVSNGISLWLFPNYEGHNATKYVLSLSVSLNGLGKEVQTQIIIDIIRGADA